MTKSIKDIKHTSYGYYLEALTVGEMIDFLQQLPRDMRIRRFSNIELVPYEDLDWFEFLEVEDPKAEYNSLKNWCVNIYHD